RNYVPKLQAVKNIIAQPQRHGAVLPLIENHPFFDTVDIKHDIDVDVAARLAQVRLEDFKALNPSQRKPVIFAAGTPQVLLPWNNAALFQQALAKADPGTLSSWTAWVAPQNLPSREVASRFGMDESDLREINNLPHGVVIKSGSTVLVRRANGSATAVASHVVNNAQLAYAPEIVLRRTRVRARKGDTIASVAARYDLPAATVAGWNGTQAGARLKPGQSVVMFLPVRASSAAARESADSPRSARADRSPGKTKARAAGGAKQAAAPTRAARGGKAAAAAPGKGGRKARR
ncbi:MAG TPA: LysM peptidoglycan-binding domain-containing protein, partial [Ottowia sp.]|nr:LysM peptidoglycan-binding domain-containing protein [Ottowia sp.]